MDSLFLKLLNMSVTSVYLVAAILILRFFLKKAPKWITCSLWGLVAMRLVCPFSFESIFSLIPSKEFLPQETVNAYSSFTPTISEVFEYAGKNPVWYNIGIDNNASIVFSEFTAPENAQYLNPLLIFTTIFSVIWVIGIVGMLIYTLMSYIRIHNRVREAVILEDNIHICDRIDTPFIFGIFRPRIYLPSNMNEQDRKYVIAHEKAHIKRLDHFWKPLGFLILSVYWFNPILWLAYVLLCRDIEFACDERVIKKMGIQIKKPYSNALINCSIQRKMIAACPLAFGETDVKGRIKSVLNYKKPAFWIIIIAIIASIVIGVCFMTNPTTSNNPTEKEDIFAENNEELLLQNASSLSYYKEFIGGTGYQKESEESSHYEYDGGVMNVEFAIDNMSNGFECGIFVALNGVFQNFTLTDSEGKTTNSDYLQKIDIPEKQKVTMTLSFTPNTGTKGETLNLAVGTMNEPSFTSVYSGWPQYSKYGYHAYSAASGMTVKMNYDSTKTALAKNLKASKEKITDSYFDYITASAEDDKKNKSWKNNHAFALYYDAYDFDKDLILVPDTDKVNLKLDILGKTATYRISLFINNELIELENGKTYFEVNNTDDKITHIEFPVDISDIPKNSNIYVIASEKDNDSSSLTYGTFIFAGKTRTCYFIKGELPEIETSIAETTEGTETTENLNFGSSISVSEGDIKALNGYELLYLSAVDNKTMCFVAKDTNMVNKAIFYDIETDSVINIVDLSADSKYYSIAGGNLISVDITKKTDGKCNVIDRNGKIVNSFSYTDNASAENESTGIFSMLSSAMKKVAINPQSGDLVYIAGSPQIASTYYIPISTGTKAKLEFFSGDNLPAQIRHFSGNNMLTLNADEYESTITLTDIAGNKVKEFNLSGKKDITCVGQYAVIYEQKNQSGVSTNNTAQILNCNNGEIKDIVFETKAENQWCTISPDAKYILTLNNASGFNLYNTDNSTIVKSFKIDNLEPGIAESKVFIDSTNKVIYFQIIQNDSYGVYAEKF